MLSVVNDEGTTETGSLMDDIVREGARRMLAAALEAEVNQYIAELAGERDEAGHRLVVRNRHHPEGKVTIAAGSVAVKVPRVNDKRVDVETGERKRFSSKIPAPWCRKSPKVSEVLPLLYLHGLSSGDFVPAMEQFLGSSTGLSPATVTRLTKQWVEDHTAFQARDLSDSDYVYVWADGVHPKVRLGQAHSCVLVLMGVRPNGRKELVALAEGLRESTESWTDPLRDCRRRGMRDPELVVAPAHDKPHRRHFQHREAADQGHPRGRQPGRGPGDGVQARRVRPGPLARDHRTSPRCPRPQRRPLQERSPRRTLRSGGRLMTPPDERRYPKLLRVPQVTDDVWLSQPEAARQLGIALFRIGAFIACGHLTPAENSAGRAGVTITSVQGEKTWRDSATYRAKALRLLKDTIGFF